VRDLFRKHHSADQPDSTPSNNRDGRTGDRRSWRRIVAVHELTAL
jgi:hypothetical protein